jgi:pimeloyl-ACP methyl ester carboxylesterase
MESPATLGSGHLPADRSRVGGLNLRVLQQVCTRTGRIIRAETPMLIMYGDRGDSLGLSSRIERERKTDRIIINISKEGHFLPMEKPELVSQLASEFLK